MHERKEAVVKIIASNVIKSQVSPEHITLEKHRKQIIRKRKIINKGMKK